MHDVHFERILKTVDRVLRAPVEVELLDGKRPGRVERVRFGGRNAYIGESERAIHLQPFTRPISVRATFPGTERVVGCARAMEAYD